jgi:hypothetical protein
MKTVILVYVNEDGVGPMVDHILDDSLKQYHPSVTVGSSLNGYPIPMMNAKGEVETDEQTA